MGFGDWCGFVVVPLSLFGGGFRIMGILGGWILGFL